MGDLDRQLNQSLYFIVSFVLSLNQLQPKPPHNVYIFV